VSCRNPSALLADLHKTSQKNDKCELGSTDFRDNYGNCKLIYLGVRLGIQVAAELDLDH